MSEPIQAREGLPICLPRLACGAEHPECTLSEILVHLAKTLGTVAKETESFLAMHDASTLDEPSSVRFALYGPFLGRSLLEVAMTAVLGRLDPFRVLVLREMQLRPEYAPEKRNAVSIQWLGDIHADKKVEDLWKIDRHVKDMTRALFGDYFDHLFWRRAFQSIIDEVPQGRGGEWMRELRLLSPESFMPVMRQKTSSAYSACSKGIHHEFVIPSASYYDSATLATHLRSAIEAVATVGMVANACRDILFQLPLDESLDYYESAQVW